jgi:amino acid transporter
VIVLYSLFLLAILIALPPKQLSAVGSFLDAFNTVNHILPDPMATVLGWLIALCFTTSLFATGVTLLIAVSRSYAIAALDRAAPSRIGRFSRTFGTPVTATIISGLVATITVIVSILLAVYGSESIETLFIHVLSVAISTELLAYLLMFPAFLILRYKFPSLPRKYRVPGGLVGAWVVTVLPMLYVGIACYFLLIPSDEYLQNNHLDRLTFELTHFVPLACIVLLTIVLYIWGQRERQNQDIVVRLGE